MTASPANTDQRLQLHAAYDLLGQMSLKSPLHEEAPRYPPVALRSGPERARMVTAGALAGRTVRDARLSPSAPRPQIMVMPLRVPIRVPTYTTDDLRRFPPDGQRYELLNGILLVTPAPGTAHQVVLSRIQHALGVYLTPAGLAYNTSPGEIEVEPSVLLDPDLLVYSSSYPPGTPWTSIAGWWLAVEVSGRASRVYDRDFKRDAYLALGVREVWLVDLPDRRVLVSRRDEPRDAPLRDTLVWHPSEMSAPLTIDLPAVFAGLG